MCGRSRGDICFRLSSVWRISLEYGECILKNFFLYSVEDFSKLLLASVFGCIV